MATEPLITVELGATNKIKFEPLDECIIDICGHRRFWHNGDDKDELAGNLDCSRAGCLCMAGRYSSDEVKLE